MLPCRRRIVQISVLLGHASGSENTGRNTVDFFCLQTRGLEYICYNHSYFFAEEREWAQCFESKSGSLLRLTLPCHRTMKRRKGTASCTANASSRTGQGAKKSTFIKKKKRIQNLGAHYVKAGGGGLWMEASPKNEDTSAINIIAHIAGIQDSPCQIHFSPLVSVPMIWKWQSHYTASSTNDKAAGNLSLLRLAGYHCLSWVSLDNHQVNARQVSYRIDLNPVSRDSRI